MKYNNFRQIVLNRLEEQIENPNLVLGEVRELINIL